MKAKLTEEDVINWWLEKYHDTNLDKVKEEHPEWAKDPEKHTRDFYAAYMVTEEQHDEWKEWLITTLMKQLRQSRRYIERGLWSVYLNTSPSVLPNSGMKHKQITE